MGIKLRVTEAAAVAVGVTVAVWAHRVNGAIKKITKRVNERSNETA
jgi:hypothetical protein